MKNVIFIVSLPRSGSTLLQKLLATSDLISTAAEPWWLLPLFTMDNPVGSAPFNKQMASKAIRSFDEYYEQRTGHSLLESMGDLANKVYAELTPEGGYFLDKTPRYYFILRQLATAFPKAKFIFLVRNPLEVLASKLRGHGGTFHAYYNYRADLFDATRHIIEGMDILDDKLHLINYDELVSKPETIAQELSQYLKIHDISSEKIQSVKLEGTMGDPRAMTAQEGIREKAKEWFESVNSPVKYLVFRRLFRDVSFEFFNYSGTTKQEVHQEFAKIHWTAYLNLWQGMIDALALMRAYMNRKT